MITTDGLQYIFFLGIGGIGMSGLARYFNGVALHDYSLTSAVWKKRDLTVCGYDRTPSDITRALEQENIPILYNDSVEEMLSRFADMTPDNTLVVRTPAVPRDTALYTYFRSKGFHIEKRAQVLGRVTQEKAKPICVAGTHGKTTVSTMIAWLMNYKVMKGYEVDAFLGGISLNFNSNVLLHNNYHGFVVVEADEYDRSFHFLHPHVSIITAVDPDHLDIYGTPAAYREAFSQYTSQIRELLIIKKGIDLELRMRARTYVRTYGVVTEPTDDLPDFYGTNIRVEDGKILFDFYTKNDPEPVMKDISIGVPVLVNVENAVAALSLCMWYTPMFDSDAPYFDLLRQAMSEFKGVWRRFNIHVNTEKVVYIDDYAHHPQEIASTVKSVRLLYPTRRLIGVFQPHLFTRTRDFAEDFKRVLGTMDETILLPIYPARELPIEGVTSEMLGGQVVEKADLVNELKRRVAESEQPVVVLTIGAGDIDRLVQPIAEALNC